MRAASDVIGEGAPLVAELGTVVCHLPQRVSVPVARLLARARRAHRAGGDRGTAPASPRPTPRWSPASHVSAARSTPTRPASRPRTAPRCARRPTPTTKCASSCAASSTRCAPACRSNAWRSCSATPSRTPRLLHDHLELAGITHNGVSVRTLADSVLGRSLLRLLALPDHDFRRDDVFALLAGAPVLDGNGKEAPAVAWERISRDGRRRAKASRSGRRGSRTTRRVSPTTTSPTATRRVSRPRRAPSRSSSAALADDLARAPGTWSELARWAHGLVARWIGTEATRAGWSEFEQEAARRVDAAVERLGTLDAVEARPTLEVFRRSLALELDAARDRVGRLGEGVLVGSAALALGVELDRVWVCGLAEGVFPAPPRDDPLLSDADRGALAGELPLRADRIANDQRALLAALASTSGDRTLCFPRGDLRRNTEHVPSRFLLDTIEALGGVRELPSDPATAPWYTVVPSFLHGLTQRAVPGHPARARRARRARAGAAHRGRPGGRARHRARAVAPQPGVHPLRRQPLAPRRRARRQEPVRARRRTCRRPASKTWVKCPHAYFVQLPAPRAADRPARGAHPALAARQGQHRARHARRVPRRSCTASPGVGRPWPRRAPRAAPRAAARGVRRDRGARARRPPAAVGAGAARAARAARRVPRLRRRRTAPSTAPTRSRPSSRSAARGSEHPPIEITCSDGRSVRIIGSIDRVDRFADGRLAVIDYKSGSTSSYTKLVARRSVARRAGCCSSRSTRTRRARTLAGGPARAGARVVLVRAARAEEAARLHRRRRGRGRARRRAARRSSAASTPATSRRGRREPGFAALHRVRLLRSRRARHDRHVPRVAPQAARGPSSPTTSSSSGKHEPIDERLSAATRPRARPCAIAARRDAVRRGGRGHRQDDGARRPHRRARHRRRPRPARADAQRRRDHLHREGGGRAARPRARASSSSGRATTRSTPHRRAPVRRGARRRSTTPRSARCTRSRNASSPRSRSRPGCRRASRCTTKCRRCSSFEERWRRTRDDLLDDPELEPVVAGPARGAGATLDHICARSPSSSTTTGTCSTASTSRRRCPRVDLDRVARRARRPCARPATTAATDDDKLLARLAELDEYGDRLRAAVDDAARIELLLADEAVVQGEPHRATRRTGPTSTACATASCGSASSATTLTKAVIDAALRAVAAFLARVHRARASPSAARAGELEFHDLLVLRRALLRDPEHGAARARAGCASGTSASSSTSSRTPIRSRSRSRRCSRRPTTPPTATTGGMPRSTPGRLFFVGDPKQSIYRFRRADISTFLAAATTSRDEPLRLTSQLPLDRAGARVDQPRVRPADPARRRLAARVLRARAPARRVPPARSGRACCSASTRSSDGSSADDAARARGGRACRRGRARAIAERWQVDDGNERLAPDPRSATSASCCRRARRSAILEQRARRRGRPVPRRDQLARVRHAARSATS